MSSLKKLRKSKKLKAEYVAEETGISIRTYRSYEQQVRKPSYDKIIKLAQVLECTTDEIMKGD